MTATVVSASHFEAAAVGMTVAVAVVFFPLFNEKSIYNMLISEKLLKGMNALSNTDVILENAKINDDVSTEDLHAISGLQKLSLADNAISADGVKALLHAFQKLGLGT